MQYDGVNMSGAGKIVVSAAIGGTTEALGGGKPARRSLSAGGFANGAVTGAYVMMFNHMMHKWHPTRESAANATFTRTETTGNGASYLTYIDDCGKEYYWEVSADPRDGPIVSYQSGPPPAEAINLVLIEQYHYSKSHIVVDNTLRAIKGSYDDWLLAHDLNITVTHHSIGIGVWIFKPSVFFTQPISVIYRNYIKWDRTNPIIPRHYKQ